MSEAHEIARLRAAIEESRTAGASAAQDLMRYRVAYDHGLSLQDADLLGDGDHEQVTARAERVLSIKSGGALDSAPDAASTPTVEDRWCTYRQLFGHDSS